MLCTKDNRSIIINGLEDESWFDDLSYLYKSIYILCFVKIVPNKPNTRLRITYYI